MAAAAIVAAVAAAVAAAPAVVDDFAGVSLVRLHR